MCGEGFAAEKQNTVTSVDSLTVLSFTTGGEMAAYIQPVTGREREGRENKSVLITALNVNANSVVLAVQRHTAFSCVGSCEQVSAALSSEWCVWRTCMQLTGFNKSVDI